MAWLGIALVTAPVLLTLMFAVFVWFARKAWNIPVIILRFVGNKGRPLLVIKKAKKYVEAGVPKLLVQGYKLPIRDFQQKNYYPTVGGAKGGLILWEYEDGMLTPALLHKGDPLTTEEEAALKVVNDLKTVRFSYDPELWKSLKLKAVDDVDIEFMLQELSRVDKQYRGGLSSFLIQHGHIIGWLILGVILLVIVVLGLKAAPDIFAQCANAATGAVKQTLLESAANAVVPPA